MTTSRRELIDGFGAAALANNAVVFVGAGMSVGAGYPSWRGLADTLRAGADIPDKVEDATLISQYYAEINGEPAMRRAMLESLAPVGDPPPTAALRDLARLPVREFWTTNYDWLLERALGNPVRIVNDPSFRTTREVVAPRRLTKMGSPGIDVG